jgi:hypothetical protein
MSEEIRGVTWDFGDKPALYPFQAAQYLYNARVEVNTTSGPQALFPFRDAKVLCKACAVMGGESGWYTGAWHANVRRNTDGTIARPQPGYLTVNSVDLGWIQRNADIDNVEIADGDVKTLVEGLFNDPTYGYLDRPALAANEAARLFVARQWKPWYAEANGGWKKHLPMAGKAVANFLAVEFGLGQSFYTIRTR